MINHIVSWNVIPAVIGEEKEDTMLKVKNSLEALTDVVPGIISINVIINRMESSTVDVTLMCKFENVEALNGYQVSDRHLEAAKYIKQVMCNRNCIDYEE